MKSEGDDGYGVMEGGGGVIEGGRREGCDGGVEGGRRGGAVEGGGVIEGGVSGVK